MRAFHSGGDNVRQAIAVHIADGHLPTESRVGVGALRDEIHAALSAREFEPIHHRAGVPLRRLLVMRPVGFAGDDVLEPVAIDVVQAGRVQFAKDNAVFVLAAGAAHDEVFFKRDAAALGFHLLEPRKAKLVRGEAGDDVVVAVAVHVVGEHLRAAACGEGKLARPPRLLVGGRLLEPAALVDDVSPPIAIHVTHTQAVPKPLRGDRAGHRVECPFAKRVFPVDRHVTKLPAPGTNQFRPSVADEIAQRRRLVAHPVKNLVPLPMPRLALRVFKHQRRRAGETNPQHIPPAIAVKIVNKGEKIVRVTIAVLQFRGINLVLRLETRPFVPVRPRDHIRPAVARHVAQPRPFAIILRGERLALERMQRVLGGCDGDRGNQEQGESVHAVSVNEGSVMGKFHLARLSRQGFYG